MKLMKLMKLENSQDSAEVNRQKNEAKNLSERLSKIKLDEEEQPTKAFIAALKKIKRPLTELEEKLLRIIEEYLKINR